MSYPFFFESSPPDWGTLIVDNSLSQRITSTIISQQCAYIQNGWIGGQLPALLKEAGLGDIHIIPHTITFRDFYMADKVLAFTKATERARL